jgi:Flp pilus assembly protein TadD
MNIDVQENFVAPRSLKELLRSGDLNAAEAIFRQQIEIDPNDADGLLGLSAIMRKRRSRKDARELLTKAAQARPIERSV